MACKIRDESPHPELYLRGTAKDSHWWKEAEREVQVKHPLWDLKSDYAQKDICEKFEAKLKEQIKRHLANPPEDVWVMERGHAAEAMRPGP